MGTEKADLEKMLKSLREAFVSMPSQGQNGKRHPLPPY
jgi:hypothetical protein